MATRGAPARVRAPELVGRGWLNTGGRPLRVRELRGKIVLLHFWTSCCVNCLHVIAELRPLQDRYRDVLLSIGVHSPKFAHEGVPAALAAAVERYDVDHPVLDDADLTTWQAYAARAWPTLVVVDPLGYVVAHLTGEGHAVALSRLVDELVSRHELDGTLRRGDDLAVPTATARRRLRYPGKAIALPPQRCPPAAALPSGHALPDGAVLVADTAHHRLVLLDPDLETELLHVGTGVRGLVDGPANAARFDRPLGMTLMPAEVAAAVGYDIVVADSANHALRGVRLSDGYVATLAGTGEQLRQGMQRSALSQPMSSPWDVAWFNGFVAVAMAGVHQLWAFVPAVERQHGSVAVLAGTGNEGLVDGPAADAWFAQPSGLAVANGDQRDGGTLWIVDAETSSLRWLRRSPVGGYEVGTVVGHGLFDFGFRDGPRHEALMQHPLDVAVLADGSIAVADTFNGAVRRYDPAMAQMRTLARGLSEPGGLAAGTAAAPVVGPDDVVVVESAAHRLVRVPATSGELRISGEQRRASRAPVELSPGPVRLSIRFTPPAGQRLDDRSGDPARLGVDLRPSGLLLSGAGTAPGLERDLVFAADAASQTVPDPLPPDPVLHVSVRVAACDTPDPGETADPDSHAACHLYQQDWGVPVRLRPGAPNHLNLELNRHLG